MLLKNKLNKKKYQVIILYLSTLLGLFIGVINSIINTRALSPSEYGDVRYVQNVISFISSFLLVGYFVSGSRLLAISNDEQYSKRIRGAMCIILLITVSFLMLCMVLLYFFSPLFTSETVSFLFLVATPICGNVLMLNYLNTTAQGDNHIGRIASARLLPSLSYCILSLPIYYFFGANSVLMLCLYNGTFVVILFLIIISTHPNFTNIKESFRLLNQENKMYGFDVYLGSLIGVSTSYLSGITLGLFCNSNTTVGFYTLSVTLSQPLIMLPSIVGTTYYKQFSTQYKIDNKVIFSTFMISIISCILFIMLIQYVVDFIYDKNYYYVGTISAYLAIGTCIHGIGDMINRFLGAHGQGKCLRNAAILSGIMTIIGSTLFVYLFKIWGAVFTSVMSSFIYFIVLLYYYNLYTKKHKQ